MRMTMLKNVTYGIYVINESHKAKLTEFNFLNLSYRKMSMTFMAKYFPFMFENFE